MILSDDDVRKFIQYPDHADAIGRASLLHRQHIRHVKGIGVSDFFIMEEIKGYENDREKLLREKISRATTVPIFSNALSTFDKAYSASGYSRYFEFKNKKENQSNYIETYLSGNIGEGLSMSGWMQQVWGDKIHYDFNGVLMVELPQLKRDDNDQIIAGQQNAPYIIFKSIYDIHDYDVDGMDLEYIILNQEPPEEEDAPKQNETNYFQYFRVIDDARDLIARIERGKDSNGKDGYVDVVILDNPQFPIIENIWKYVPAIIISNQRDAQSDSRQSFIWEAIGTADDYLLDSSIHNISKKKHGFPQKWSYAVPCKQCDGKGRFPIFGVRGEMDISSGANSERPIINFRKCSDCDNGSIYVSPSVSMIKPMPDAANPDIGEPFGYVTPPIDSLKAQTEELDRLEEIILNAVFPTPNYKNVKLRTDITATGEVLGVSAKQDKLNKFSNNGERVEEFLTDTIAKAIYGDAFSNSIVRWGRKYYIYSENELEMMFQSAKNAGVSATVLKSYLEELIYVRYGNDSIELHRQLKLFECEPLVYMTTKDVQALQYCAISDKFLKTYFNDYIEQIEREQPDLIALGTVDDIIAEMKILNEAKMQDANSQTAADPNNPANKKIPALN